ncbi:MAG: fucose permease [Halioglobus sp.]|jgi:fucose permease
MTTLNIVRIVLTSFIAYAVMASIMTPLGIISQPISDLFNVLITETTSKFSYITSGILAGSVAAFFIFDWFKVKTVIIVNCIVIAIAITLLYLINDYTWLPICFVAIGISSSVNLTASAIVITRVFSEGKRASMLLLTDCFYSLGAMGSSYAAAYLIAQKYHWVSAYLLVLFLVIVIVVIASLSSYTEEEAAHSLETLRPCVTEKWPLSVYFCSASIFLYLLGMVSLYSWMPNYAQSVLHITQEKSGQLLSYYFAGMFVGQIGLFFLVLKFPIGRLILITSGCAAIINSSLWNISNVDTLTITLFLLGVFAGGLLKTFITYGTLAMANSPTRLVSFLMLSMGLGTAVAPAISASIVAQTSAIGALMLSSFCYVMTFIFAVVCVYLQSRTPLIVQTVSPN